MYLSMVQQRSRLLASGLSVFLLVAAGAGCSTNNASNSNGSSGVSCAPPPSTLPGFPVPQGPPVITGGFAYAVKTFSHKVVWYKVENSGALASSGEICAGFQPTFIAAHPTRKLVYVTNYNSGTVSAYTIDAASGALTPVPGSPFPAGNGPGAIAVNPSRDVVYVTNFDSDTISVYEIETTGALKLVQTLATGGGPDAIAINSARTLAYVVNFRADRVSAYKIDTTGRLEAGVSTTTVPARGPNAITISPTDSSLIYVTNEETHNVSAYRIVDAATGQLASLSGSPFATGLGPEGVVVDPTGKFVYVSDGQADTISIYTIGAGGMLQTPRSPISTLPARDPEGIVMDSVTNTIYVVNRESDDVSAYKISNSTTGALSLVGQFGL